MKITRHTACQHGTVSHLHQQPVDAVLRPTFIRKLCYKLPSIATFTLIQTFDIMLSSSLNGAKVGVSAWCSVKIRLIFSVWFERRKVDNKSKPTWKLKHANSILQYFEYFCQISSKSIFIISTYIVSKLVRFWDTVYYSCDAAWVLWMRRSETTGG